MVVVDTAAAAQPGSRGQSCGHCTPHLQAIRKIQIMATRAAHPPIMCVTEASLIQGKQLLQLAQREMSFHILLFIHHTTTQCLLVALTLKDLLLDGSCLGEGWGRQGSRAKSSPYIRRREKQGMKLQPSKRKNGKWKVRTVQQYLCLVKPIA